MAVDGRKGRIARLVEFITSTYAPGMHFGFAALWFLSLLGGFVSLDETVDTWILDLKALLGILTLFCTLFLLRAVDEIKDYDYDKVHHPDRPLVTGAVSRSDLVSYIAGTSILLILMNGFLSWILLLIIMADIGYGVFLVWLEKHSNRVKEWLFLNLVVTYPVNVALSVYTYFFFLERVGGRATDKGVSTIIAFAAAFLHWEFCRKTYWPHHAEEGMRLYSDIIGARGSSWMALALALVATGTMIVLIEPWACSGISALSGWLVLVPISFALLGRKRFYEAKSQATCTRKAAVMVPFATYYLVLFYVTLIVHTAARKDVLFRVW